MLYLLNCLVSGLDQVITTEAELGSLIGYDEQLLHSSLTSLAGKNMIKLHYVDPNKLGHDTTSLRVGLQYDMTKWVLSYAVEATSKDAVVFPFRRQGKAALQVLDGQKKDPKTKWHVDSDEADATWQRVLASFASVRSLDDDEKEEAEASAKMLVDVHPVDQVLLIIRHFGSRIPTLSLLASSWQHFQELFETETQKVDMLEARQKHQEIDKKLREQASALLADENLQLKDEERGVLQILVKHQRPRQQLFWAYQRRTDYPNLQSFFADNVSIMLSVTTGGTVVKKHD